MTGRDGSIRPLKSLSQNFLRDANIARKIVRAIQPLKNETLVEIGPGEGAVTSLVADLAGRTIAVEIDSRAAALLAEQFADTSVEVVQGDFLDFDLEGTAKSVGGPVRVFGNIPYNITTPIIFRILDNRRSVKDATLMIQKEVAERIVADPGSKSYGIPSVLCQCFCNVVKLFDVSPNVFFPKPSVNSSVIQLVPLDEPLCWLRNEEFFRSMVRSVFGKRRKTLRNSLKSFLGDIPIDTGDFDLGRRPEELSIKELAELSNKITQDGDPRERE